MKQENGEPATITKLLIIAGCAVMIAAISGLIVLEQSGSHPTPLPPAPSAFYPAHWKLEELEAEIGHKGYLETIALVTEGTVYRLHDRNETGLVRNLPQSDLSLLRQVLSNHLSYGIPYASIHEPVYVLRLQGPAGAVEIEVDKEGSELCVCYIDGQDCHTWFACSGEAQRLLDSIGRQYLGLR